jgi:hypothetical protein
MGYKGRLLVNEKSKKPTVEHNHAPSEAEIETYMYFKTENQTTSQNDER